MCSPLAIAGIGLATNLGLGVAQTMAQYQGQKQQADAQRDYQLREQKVQEQRIQENYTRAMEAYRFKLMSEQIRLEEVRKAATAQTFNVRQASLRAQSSAAAQAASRGAAGQSTYLALADYLTQAGFSVSGINEQFEAEAEQSTRNKQAFYAEAKARATSVQPYVPRPVEYPSAVGAALQIGGQAVNAFNQFGSPLVNAFSMAPSMPSTNSAALIRPEPTTGRFPGPV